MLFSKPEQEVIVVTFFNIADAVAFEKVCKARGISGRLIAIPRQLSAGCGMAWSSPVDLRDDIEALIAQGLEHEEVHIIWH